MRCETFEDRLNQVLDRRDRPEEDALLSEHAAACAACREALEAQAGLFDTVRDWSVADLEVDLVDRVMAKVRPSGASEGKRGWPHWLSQGAARWFGLGVAAAVLLAVGVWNRRPPADGGAGPGPEAPAMAKAATPQDAVRKAAHELTDAEISAVARRLGQRVTELGRMAQEIELPESVAAGLRPLRHTMAAAYDALKKTIPSKSEQPTSRSSSLRVSTFDARAVA